MKFKSVGLKRGTVKLVPHDRRWKALFERERQRLLASLKGSVIDIQHIGSTSIPGTPAKPIIDISMGIRSMKDSKKFVKRMRTLGYEWRPKFGGERIQLLFVKGKESNRTHYLHLMKYGGSLWRNDLFFGDYLRTHKNRATKYAALKRRLANRHADDRATYTKRKARFILDTIKLAKRLGRRI